MSLSKSKCWCSNNCLQFFKHAVPFGQFVNYDSKKFYKVGPRTLIAKAVQIEKFGSFFCWTN
jgi:hypothetical protein